MASRLWKIGWQWHGSVLAQGGVEGLALAVEGERYLAAGPFSATVARKVSEKTISSPGVVFWPGGRSRASLLGRCVGAG
jgi:hypothetical protein